MKYPGTMDKKRRVFVIVLEVMQWLLIATVMVLCFLICSRVGKHMKSEQDIMLYHQIDNTRRIETLNEEKMILIDSLTNKNSDTVYITRWIASPCE